MARSEEIYVSGKTKWFRHDRPEAPKEGETARWSHVLYPNEESLEKIRELQSQGVKNVLHKDEDGYFIRFHRPTKVKRKGNDQALNPPIVVLSDGQTPLQGLVGNGSDITTKLEVYSHRIPGTTRTAKAARWKSSRIDTLIPYTPPTDFTPIEAAAVKGLAEQPKQEDFF